MFLQKSQKQGGLCQLEDKYHAESVFARELIQVVQDRKIILNFDESIIREESNHSKSWAFKCKTSARHFKRTLSVMQILMAVDSEGNIFFDFLRGSNNKESVSAFFIKLAAHLDIYSPDRRS
jgi:hypothetical protein